MSANLSVVSQLNPNSTASDGSSRKPIEWHVITPEYPPQLGGVSGYTCQLAAGLAAQGDAVHVWSTSGKGAPAGEEREEPGVTVHRECGSFSPSDLRRLDQFLDSFASPRRILVQWVPHGYGYRSMNVAFCWWLWRRASRRGDRVELMVHEPFLAFRWNSPRQNAAALVHRWMTILLLRTSARVWISIPGWESVLQRYALGRSLSFHWLPIFSNIPVADDPAQIQAVRCRYASGDRILVGHFGTFGSGVSGLLDPILTALGDDPVEQTILLMGEGSETYRAALVHKEPRLAAVIQATGPLAAPELAHHLAACDILIQPYPDGVSSRRTSLMAGLSNGQAIVTTTGWLTEPVWRESDAVALAPAGDAEAFLQQVRRLRADRAERQRIGCAAGRLYRERFDISHTISTLQQTDGQ